MPKSRFLLGIPAALLLLPVASAAQPTCDLPVNAYVTDAAGVALDGDLDVELRFYTDGAPDAVAAECRSFEGAPAEDGWLRLTVDACGAPAPGDCGATPLSDLLGSGADALWVGVFVGGLELEPRTTLGAVPFAVHSVRAEDAGTLQGRAPDSFETAGAVDSHAADPDAHHSSTSDGIAITPASVEVGDTRMTDGSVDLGVDADDELTVEIVRTLTGGGDADALHGHAASSSAGGACLTAWGRSDCPADYALFYSGIAVQGYGAHRDFGSSDTLTMALGDTLCVDPAGIDAGAAFSPGNYTAGLVELGAPTVHQSSGGLACAVCCR